MTTTQTPAERLLAQVADDERLAAAATPGPWEHEENEVLWKLMGSIGDGTFHGLQIAKCPKRGTPYAEYWPAIDDANFIAASRSIVPRQASQLRVLVDGVDGLRDKIEQEWALRDKGDEFAQELNEWLGDIDGIFEAAAAMMSGDADAH